MSRSLGYSLRHHPCTAKRTQGGRHVILYKVCCCSLVDTVENSCYCYTAPNARHRTQPEECGEHISHQRQSAFRPLPPPGRRSHVRRGRKSTRRADHFNGASMVPFRTSTSANTLIRPLRRCLAHIRWFASFLFVRRVTPSLAEPVKVDMLVEVRSRYGDSLYLATELKVGATAMYLALI